MKQLIALVFLCLFAPFTFAQPPTKLLTDHPGQIKDDSALIQAMKSKRNEFYLEAAHLTVSKILPDDKKGLRHQKWQATLSDGSKVTIVYNSKMGERIPVQIGDQFDVGGQFLWLGQKNGGLVHWVHDDPSHQRPDGYVYLHGVVYGDTNSTHH